MNLNPFRRRRPEPVTATFNDSVPVEATVDATPAPHYIISGDLNVTLVLDGQTRSIGTSHPNHAAILDAIRNRKWSSLPDLVDVPQAMVNYSQGNVTVNEFGEVSYAGEPVHNTVAKRITTFFQQGLPFEPLVRFLENLMANPSRRAVEELYGFLENEGMAITEDGCFVGYKAVRTNYMDIHSGKFENKPGAVHVMPRNLVDDDARRACSNGFHIGSQAYAASFGGPDARVMLVKVNPADAVSVPYDGGEKLRACRYEVLREVDKSTLIQTPMYRDADLDLDDEEEEDDYEECDDCGEPVDWCVCDDEDEDEDDTPF